jgi:hypothetical protein
MRFGLDIPIRDPELGLTPPSRDALNWRTNSVDSPFPPNRSLGSDLHRNVPHVLGSVDLDIATMRLPQQEQGDSARRFPRWLGLYPLSCTKEQDRNRFALLRTSLERRADTFNATRWPLPGPGRMCEQDSTLGSVDRRA